MDVIKPPKSYSLYSKRKHIIIWGVTKNYIYIYVYMYIFINKYVYIYIHINLNILEYKQNWRFLGWTFVLLPAADALPSVFSAPKDQPPASRHLAYRHWSGIPGAPGCLVINAVMGPPINGRNSMGFTGFFFETPK